MLQVAVYHEEIKKDLQNITNFINKFNWEGIHFLSEKDNWKKFDKNVTIVLNVLHAKKNMHISYLCFKNNSNHEKNVILLMIVNGKGWHYLAEKKYQHY